MSDPSTPITTIKSFPENIDVSISVPYVDQNGDATAPSAASYRVTDENNLELVPLTAVSGFVPGQLAAAILVPAAANLLPTQPILTLGMTVPDRVPLRALRVVEVQMTVAAGIQITKGYYSINARLPLQLLVNSFQTYEHSLMERFNMPALDGWDSATDLERQSAMVESFFRLQKLGYRIKMAGWGDSPPAGYSVSMPWLAGDWVISPRIWPIMQVDWWTQYPQHFKEAMYRAQIAEADVILNGDIVAERRADGLLSETIGSSSMMFRSGKPLDMPISKQTAKYLTNYIEWRLTTTRS